MVMCPKCHCKHCPPTGRYETRLVHKEKVVEVYKRYRECRHCKYTFTTVEIVESETPGMENYPEIAEIPYLNKDSRKD